jgi:cell division transport system ATP-binding protein
MFALKNVTKIYGKTKVLSGASLTVQPKDSVCIIGDGSSGKSTVLKLLMRLEDPTSGTVEVDGVDLKIVPPAILQLYRRRIGAIFQEPMLMEHATVRENIALPLELFGVQKTIIDKAVDDLLKRLQLASKADVPAGELSLSEQALTGIARAMVTAPMVIIADEPMLHLDEAQKKTVSALLLNMHKKGTTLIVASRDQATADALNARIVQLQNGAFVYATRKPAAPKQAQPHRILEEPEIQAGVPDDPPAKDDKSEGNGRKIRITSIGSL